MLSNRQTVQTTSRRADNLRVSQASSLSTAESTHPALSPDEARHLTTFARACKAAQRAVLLYPDGHTAIASALGRLVEITAPGSLAAPLRIGVLVDSLLLDGKAPVRPDGAIAELAALLHAHLIGELTVHPGGDRDAWRQLLMLLGRSPESIRSEGGIARVWIAMAGRHVELREVDYAEVLRERDQGTAADWDQIIARCLQGQSTDLTDPAMRGLLDIVRDAGRLADLVTTLESRANEAGIGSGPGAEALLRLLGSVVAAVQRLEPDQMDVALDNLATALAQLSPDMLASLVERRHDPQCSEAELVDAIVRRMSDGTMAEWVARQSLTDEAALDRVAHAFRALVPTEVDRARVLALAHDEAATTPLGSVDGFEAVWSHVAEKLLTSYSDKAFVSEGYGHELSKARTQAISIDRVEQDPADRVSAWISTVSTAALRQLDQVLVLDLLRIEEDPEARGRLVRPVASLIEAHLLTGEFGLASELVAAVAADREPDRAPARRDTAAHVFESVVSGPILMRQVVTQVGTIDDAAFERMKALCVTLGSGLVPPLAEALSTEERERSRERLTALLVAYGATGRQEVERLKASPNPSVRRTAVYLLREFGGTEALPELVELLNDAAPQVQREAVRAILNIGTDHAYRILEEALTKGGSQSREAIMQAVGAVHDDRATPLYAYILGHVDHRGPLRPIYIWAVEALGAFKDPLAVTALSGALMRGEWWAPFRTRALRHAAAAALARIGTSDAYAALEQAMNTGSGGIRRAVRAHLADSREARR